MFVVAVVAVVAFSLVAILVCLTNFYKGRHFKCLSCVNVVANSSQIVLNRAQCRYNWTAIVLALETLNN